MLTDNLHSNYTTIFKVALTCVLTGGLFGAFTNMINGAVSPYYFQSVMGWDFPEIWTACVAQVILEGLLYGFFCSLIFTTGFGVITKGKATFKFAINQIMKIMVIVFSCWAIGGILAVFLSNLSPQFYIKHFPYAPLDRFDRTMFAWVGGSIWGGILGGLLSSILGVVVVKNSWNKEVTA